MSDIIAISKLINTMIVMVRYTAKIPWNTGHVKQAKKHRVTLINRVDQGIRNSEISASP